MLTRRVGCCKMRSPMAPRSKYDVKPGTEVSLAAHDPRDTGALGDGAIINFTIVDRRVRFEVSLDAASTAGLSLSSRLLALALRIERNSLRLEGRGVRWVRRYADPAGCLLRMNCSPATAPERAGAGRRA